MTGLCLLCHISSTSPHTALHCSKLPWQHGLDPNLKHVGERHCTEQPNIRNQTGSTTSTGWLSTHPPSSLQPGYATPVHAYTVEVCLWTREHLTSFQLSCASCHDSLNICPRGHARETSCLVTELILLCCFVKCTDSRIMAQLSSTALLGPFPQRAVTPLIQTGSFGPCGMSFHHPRCCPTPGGRSPVFLTDAQPRKDLNLRAKR